MLLRSSSTGVDGAERSGDQRGGAERSASGESTGRVLRSNDAIGMTSTDWAQRYRWV